MKTISKPIAQFFNGLWRFLTEPFEPLPNVGDQRRSVTTTAFLLFATVSVAIEQSVAGNTPFSALLLLFAGYFLARTRWFKFAALILIFTLIFPSYLVALQLPNPEPNRIVASFTWVIIPLLLASLIYSVKTTTVISVVNFLALTALPFIRPELNFQVMGGAIGFYGLTSVILIIVTTQRNEIESDRQKELISSRQSLSLEIVERKRFAEQAQRRADQLVMLNEVNHAISGSQGLEYIFNTIFEQAKRQFQPEVFYICTIDEKNEFVTFPILFDNGKLWDQNPTPLSKTPRIRDVIQSRKPLLINPAPAEMEVFEKSGSHIGDQAKTAASIIITPLFTGSKVIGAISIQSYSPGRYKDDDLILLTAIAQQVAVAIENAHLLEQTEKRAQRLAILNDIGRELSTLTDLSTLFENVYQQAQRALSADLFFVGLYNKDKNLISFPLMYDDGRRWQQNPTPVTESTFSGKTILTKNSLLINEWSASTEESVSSPTIIGDEKKLTKSLMFAPMLSGTETIGVISVQSYNLNAYSQEDLNLLTGIANQVGVAIQNSRLLESTKQNEGYLATLNELGRVVSELRPLPDLLEVIYQEVKKHLSVDAFFVGLHHPENNSVTYPLMYDEGIRYQLKPDVLSEGSFLNQLFKGAPPSLILRTEDEIKPKPDQEGMLGNQAKRSASLLVAPLKVGEKIIGVISAQSYTLNAYTENNLNLLVGIGNQVGVAIQNARLLEEAKYNAQQLSILNEVGQAVAKLMDLPDLLEVVYEQGKKSLSLDVFVVGLYHPEVEEVSFPILYDSGVRYEQDRGYISKNSFLRRFLNGEKAILILRTEEEVAAGATSQKTLGKENNVSASLMAAPLLSRGQVIGMISAQSYLMNAYDESDLKLLEGIANQVAIAIENSRLYTSAQQELKERERAEMELQKERDFAVQVMNTLGQGVSVSMLDGVYEYVNPAYAQMLGHKPEDMIGEPSDHFSVPEDAGIHSEQRKYRQEGESTTYETRLKHKDGHIVHALVTGVPRYANGRIIGSISAITDLSERKKAEIEREKLITEMDAKNAELERFTYTVSHDLKSPLVTIGGFLGFLEQDIQKEKYDGLPRTVTRIREAAKKMQRLLEELLELSRIGRIANPSQDVPFGELVSETLELVHGQLQEKQVEVQVDAEFPIVHVDRVRMVEVIQNLVANAIKFTDREKSPKIHIGMEAREGENYFFVKDNGIGIAPEFHERIFGLFNKLDPFSDGTGIGLALVKRIIEVHGGTIWVESEIGKGTTFYFTIKNEQEIV